MPTTILDGETYEQARHRRFTEEAKVIEKMQQDEIIRMAQEAGFDIGGDGLHAYHPDTRDELPLDTYLEHFAALVAANEREKLTVFDNSLKGQTNGTDNYKIYDGHYCNCSESALYSGGYQRTPTQVNQNPVAWYLDTFDEDGELDYREYNSSNKFSCGRGNGTPLYTAPVRTKNLTDDEIHAQAYAHLEFDERGFYCGSQGLCEFAHAVIAAYKEKNK